MTAFKLDRFAGLIPRTPPSLLPPANATTANHCDFAYGELRGTKADLFIKNMDNVAKAIYTDDGILFYSWPTDVNAVRSPMASDTFNRLYYTTETDFRVTGRAGMTNTGGLPAWSYRVGVPRPTAAPTLPAGIPVDTSVAAVVLPIYFSGTSTTSYGAGTMGTTIGSATMTVPNGCAVAVIATWKAEVPSGPATNTTIVIEVDGVEILNTAHSCQESFAQSHCASATTDLIAGSRVFTVHFGNGWYEGSYILSQWSITVIPIVGTGASPIAAVDITRAYTYTFVNIYGEEGPPAPPTMVTFPLGTISIGVTYTVPLIDYAPIKEIRLYRTPDGSSIADYFYVGTISMLGSGDAVFTFIDNIASSALNEVLASSNYYAPDPMLTGLMPLPNGILMAWKGNEVHFSDAYKPWSWPPSYVLTFGDYSVVGAITVGASVLVTTTGKPFSVSGISPDSMTNSSINLQQAGVSKWALADIGGQIVYASHDGIVVFDGGNPSLAFSNNYFTRETWRNLYSAGLSTMHFAVWDGRLIVYSSTAAFTPFMVGLDEARGAMTRLPAMTAQCTFVSPIADQCYCMRGTGLYQFAAGTAQTATWASREMVLLKPINYGVAQAICSGDWTISFLADGVLRHTQNVTGNSTFRLPGGFVSDRWSIEITGSGLFRELRVAETSTELKVM